MRLSAPKQCIHCGRKVVWKQTYLGKWEAKNCDDGAKHQCAGPNIKIYTKEEIAKMNEERKIK
jgi:hypothetical protein